MKSDDLYSARIFLDAVIPLFKEVALYQFPDKFANKQGVVQFRVNSPEGDWGTHFTIDKGEIITSLGVIDSPTVELYFKSVDFFNAFFKGKTKKLPKIKGFGRLGLLAATFKTLLKISALLNMKEAPKDAETQKLLAKLYFYLLSSGISVLNKAGHPDVVKWSKPSPDRVYAFTIDGEEDLAAFVRVKAGKTKASRGRYKRSKPFMEMNFADVQSALGILMQTADMLALTAEKKLNMKGAPEYGAKLGDLMMLVGSYAQG